MAAALAAWLIVCATLADLAQAIIVGHMRVNADFAADICFDNSGSTALGVMFLVMSLLCRLGAEQKQAA